jgi:hypothetical protein
LKKKKTHRTYHSIRKEKNKERKEQRKKNDKENSNANMDVDMTEENIDQIIKFLDVIGNDKANLQIAMKNLTKESEVENAVHHFGMGLDRIYRDGSRVSLDVYLYPDDIDVSFFIKLLNMSRPFRELRPNVFFFQNTLGAMESFLETCREYPCQIILDVSDVGLIQCSSTLIKVKEIVSKYYEFLHPLKHMVKLCLPKENPFCQAYNLGDSFLHQLAQKNKWEVPFQLVFV